ncbi:ATPase FliI/YscN family protein [Treponema maltophilum ATCC 51939]|mgnify:FL=1|uniref:ATPase FliI/YscN family protein n=1 Tax=Treponema maltophilum ATCC 51939 TaxID=1125699 RepID=S3K2D5_TREMA|nr:FliI/YscN family ATPase [Treponema maltophilum]EPF31086.1 ATPase FliI/YscN family protein [Treponema maltophilum ATCC 51939]
METIFTKYMERVEQTETVHYIGSVIRVRGMLVESRGPQAVIGEICKIAIPSAGTHVLAEVVGLYDTTVQLMAYGDTKGIEIGCTVTASGSVLQVAVGRQLLGRVLDAVGKAYDKKGEIAASTFYPAIASPPDPLDRTPVNKRIVTGVRAIDSLLAVGKGQRLGIFSGSGVGKSTLLGMIARNTNADVNVIALIGERGREVVDFLQRDLGEDGLKRSVVVVATSDQSPIARLRGAYTATAVAEYFRDQGKDVMLMFDSVTRFARAQREIGLAIGEPPAQRGYTPSVFETLPKLLERSGTSQKGSITGFYTVLVDGDDMDEPVSDTVRGILDGHIVLNRKLAQAYHFPAIDVLASISRLSKRVTGPQTQKAVAAIRRSMAAYAQSEDMITVGAYQKGSNAEVDAAIELHPAIENFLMQEEAEKTTIEKTLTDFGKLAGIEIPAEEWQTA